MMNLDEYPYLKRSDEQTMKPSINRDRLVSELCDRGLYDLATRASKGEFSDYRSKHAAPVSELVRELNDAGADDLAQRAIDGDFDHEE